MIPKSGFRFSVKIMPKQDGVDSQKFMPPEPPATTIG
jgi:hypothetical protein